MDEIQEPSVELVYFEKKEKWHASISRKLFGPIHVPLIRRFKTSSFEILRNLDIKSPVIVQIPINTSETRILANYEKKIVIFPENAWNHREAWRKVGEFGRTIIISQKDLKNSLFFKSLKNNRENFDVIIVASYEETFEKDISSLG